MNKKTNDKYRIGNIVKARVSGITEYGIFVNIDNLYSGLIHISSMSEKFVKDPKTFASVNDIINVEIIDVDNKNHKMKLSIKNLRYKDKKISSRRIEETEHGFDTLKSKLPDWIDKNLKSEKKTKFFVDK